MWIDGRIYETEETAILQESKILIPLVAKLVYDIILKWKIIITLNTEMNAFPQEKKYLILSDGMRKNILLGGNCLTNKGSIYLKLKLKGKKLLKLLNINI